MKLRLIILLFFCSVTSGAKQKLSTLDNALLIADWDGAVNFIKKIEEQKINVCDYLEKSEVKYKDTTYIIRRILMISALTNCSQKNSLIEKYISRTDAVLLSTVIDTATSLAPTEKKIFLKKVQNIKKNEKDPLVQDAAERFISSLK